MLRHIYKPLHVRVLELRVGIESSSYGVRDFGLTLLFEEIQQTPLGFNQFIYLLCFFVQKTGDGLLLIRRRNYNKDSSNFRSVDCRITHACRLRDDSLYEMGLAQSE